MADRYLIFGATYNGDGTTSSEAGSNGGVGAWNQESILTGTAPTYGTLAAGTDVHIRSKTGNGANANKTITLSATASFGSANATAAAPIRWILDNGVVWSGIDGVLTITKSSQSYGTTLVAYNHFICRTEDAWVWTSTAALSSISTVLAHGIGTLLENALIDCSQVTGNYNNKVSGGDSAIHINVHTKAYVRMGPLFDMAGYKKFVMINPRIELPSAIVSGYYIFAQKDYATKFSVYGGRIYGTGATTGVCLADVGGSATVCDLELIGTVVPNTIVPYLDTESGLDGGQRVAAMGLDSSLGAILSERWGHASSRDDGNFPTLNATLPTSGATPWSWWLYPLFASAHRPMVLPITKLYSSAADDKTVTLEILVSNVYTGLDTSNTWLDVMYIDDTTGLPKYVTSRNLVPGTALTTSSASWTKDAEWGSVTCDKKKLEVVTPTAIKQDTMITAVLWGTVTPDSANDIMFVCPDLQLTAAP